jgi:ABC-type phosphate transport system ATPase subunit
MGRHKSCTMAELSKKEIGELVVDFLNENGMWQTFKDFIEQKGYSLSELSIEDDE